MSRALIDSSKYLLVSSSLFCVDFVGSASADIRMERGDVKKHQLLKNLPKNTWPAWVIFCNTAASKKAVGMRKLTACMNRLSFLFTQLE